MRWCGTDGAFAGYDLLEVGDLSGIVGGTVVLEAFLIDADEGSHVVELVATRPAARTTVSPTEDAQVLVHGVGRALETRSVARG